MTTLTIKNVPEHIHKQLRLRAAARRRSLNGELLHIIETALSEVQEIGPDAAEILYRARELRTRFKGELSIEEVEAAINEGRP